MMSSLQPECHLMNGDIHNKSMMSLSSSSDNTSPMIGIDMASALINEALAKFKNSEENNSYPDDSKLLANPKGIIKSYLNQAEATDPIKFDAYRKLCVAHIKEFQNHQKGTSATCLVCNEVFQHWNTLQRHLQTHVDFRPFSCEICNRTFYSQSKLKRHAVIHNDIKPYKCPVCDRRLGRTEHLKRHLLVHTDNKPYGCSGCAHTTKRLDGIRRHIKRKHGSSAEIISLTSKDIEPQIFERFNTLMTPVENRDAAAELDSKSSETTSLDTKINLNDNFSNDFKDPTNCMISTHFLEEAEDFRTSCNSTQTVDASKMSNCIGTGKSDPQSKDNEGDMNRSLLQSSQQNHNQVHEPKQSQNQQTEKRDGADQRDSKFPAWDHRPLMLPTQFFYQSLSRAHSSKSTQNQLSDNSGQNNQVNCNKPVAFQSPPRTNSLNYNDSLSFAPNNSNVPSRYPPPVDALGMPLRNPSPMLLSPGCSGPGIGRYNQVDMTNVSSLSTEMMISQYFHSHQRFAPPVWGFATNPTYPNY